MKRVAVMLIIGFTLFSISPAAFAAKKPAPKAAPTLTEQQRAVIAGQAASELNGKSWSITLTQLGPKGGKVMQDVLTFSANGGVTSNLLAARGYSASGYAINTVNDNGAAVWEMVMSTTENDLAIWKGEYANDVIQGALSIKPKSAAMEHYSFTSSYAAQAQAAVPVATQPAVAQTKK